MLLQTSFTPFDSVTLRSGQASPPVNIFQNLSIKKELTFQLTLRSSGNWTRTSDLRVMSPTSYLLLYPAIWIANIQLNVDLQKYFYKIIALLNRLESL